jgi:hypothetical protein
MAKSGDAAVAAVWKETRSLSDAIEVELPQGSELLKIGDQEGGGGALTFWFLVRDLAGLNGDTAIDRPKEIRRFFVLGTGHTVREDRIEAAEFRETIVTAGGLLVWHVFEEASS